MGRHIGLVAPKHAGKTTAGNYLVEQLSYTKIALADPLKNTAVDMINTFHKNEGLPPIDRAFLDKHKDEVFVPFLQWLGTDYGREFLHTEYRWINKFLSASVASPDRVVCDDIRFINEANILRDNGFLIVKLLRPAKDRAASLKAAGINLWIQGHKSETEVEQIVPDIWLQSDTVAELQSGIHWCVEFQTLCNEMMVMAAHVPHDAHPGYNADFNEKARICVEMYEVMGDRIDLHHSTILPLLIKMRNHAWA